MTIVEKLTVVAIVGVMIAAAAGTYWTVLDRTRHGVAATVSGYNARIAAEL